MLPCRIQTNCVRMINCIRERNRNFPGSSVGIANDYGLDPLGIESRWGERYSARADRPWGYRVFPGSAADHSPPSSASVIEE